MRKPAGEDAGRGHRQVTIVARRSLAHLLRRGCRPNRVLCFKYLHRFHKVSEEYPPLSFAGNPARRAAVIRLDKKREASEREQLAAQYADRAMHLLRQASDGGLFVRRSMLSGLKTCSDFEALRSRPDFQQLVTPPPTSPLATSGAAP